MTAKRAQPAIAADAREGGATDADPRAADVLTANVVAARQVLDSLTGFAAPLQRAADAVRDALLVGRKVLACGNGGSAADSAHFTAEIAGRFVTERPGYPALDLTASHSLTTALINDYPAEELFARQVVAFGQPGDVLVVFTTSGNSANVQRALGAATERGLTTIAFLGRDGGACKGKADIEFIIDSQVTARIQEAHLLLYHCLCEIIDPALAREADRDEPRP